MTTVQSSPRETPTSSSSNLETREDILKRQLLEKRQARLAAQLPVKPEASSSNAPSAGLSIKGKGKEKELSLKDRIAGMRAWDEVPAQPVEVIQVAQEDDGSSSLAYPRTRSPSPRRSRSPLPRHRERRGSSREDSERRSRSSVSPSPPPRRSPSPLPPRRRGSSPPRTGSPPPRNRDRNDSTRTRRSRSPVPYRRREDRSPIRQRSHSRNRQERHRSPIPPPRRTFDNPDRLAMRQGHTLPPHPNRSNGHHIHAEPMRGPDLRERRQSPSYKPYERPPHLNGAGVGDGGYVYGPGRRDLGPAGPPGAGQRSQGGGWQNPPRRNNGPVNFEQRRIQREQSTVIAWPPSPEQPYRDEAEIEADRRAARKASKSNSKSKKSKHRSRYSSASSSESSESEDDRRSKRRKRDKRRKYASSDSDSEEEVEKRRRSRKSKSKSKSRARSMVATISGEDEWLEKDSKIKPSENPMSLEDLRKLQLKKKEEEEEIGPILPGDTVRVVQRQRYEDMRPGEAEAMALYASNGMRIPRRGEIGIDTGRIETLEDSGYVMSGARNKKMNAMRLRKENQVISAEEKRAILNLQREEKIKREGMIVSQFRELMNTAVQRQD